MDRTPMQQSMVEARAVLERAINSLTVMHQIGRPQIEPRARMIRMDLRALMLLIQSWEAITADLQAQVEKLTAPTTPIKLTLAADIINATREALTADSDADTGARAEVTDADRAWVRDDSHPAQQFYADRDAYDRCTNTIHGWNDHPNT